jgi:hypothetical protein
LKEVEMPSGIDYSKWDKFDASSSSDEENASVLSPRVTRLDEPGQVTRSANGTITISPSTPKTSEINKAKANLGEDNYAHQKKVSKGPGSEDSGTQVGAVFTKNGGEFRDADTKSFVLWSQDRYEVMFRIHVNPTQVNRKNLSIKVDGMVPYTQRFSTTSSQGKDGYGRLTVSAGSKLLLQGDLPHPVHFPEHAEEEGDSGIDWELMDTKRPMKCPPIGSNQTKCVQFALFKASPMEGVLIWWSRPLKHCAAMDVNQIKKQRIKNGTGSHDSPSTKPPNFADTWEQAHNVFREKMGKRAGSKK